MQDANFYTEGNGLLSKENTNVSPAWNYRLQFRVLWSRSSGGEDKDRTELKKFHILPLFPLSSTDTFIFKSLFWQGLTTAFFSTELRTLPVYYTTNHQ